MPHPQIAPSLLSAPIIDRHNAVTRASTLYGRYRHFSPLRSSIATARLTALPAVPLTLHFSPLRSSIATDRSGALELRPESLHFSPLRSSIATRRAEFAFLEVLSPSLLSAPIIDRHRPLDSVCEARQ